MAYTKTRADAPEGFFAAEAAGLRWLAVPGGVPVVGVHDVSRTRLVIDRVETGPATAQAAEQFGRQLVRTHDAGASCFGVGPDGGPGLGWIGDAPLPLRATPAAGWGVWYAEDRLLHHARRAGLHDPALTRVVDRLAAGEFDDDAPPARLHGDLWSGNVLHSARGPALVDPACAFAEREAELGLSTLFGGLSERALAAYQEAWPLPAGWRERNPLYQLYHLLNHQLLFGGGYGAQALGVARRYLG